MEYKGTDAVEPYWNMLDSFIPADLIRALRADESLYTHAIALPVSNPNEISSIFDDISYGKGSSVIRMLEAYLKSKFGDKYFFSKLHDYLKLHAYSNARTSDLWDAFYSTELDVSLMMKTWTDQPGFPFVTVSDINKNSFSVEQSRFLFNHLNRTNFDIPELHFDSYGPKSAGHQSWYIPITYSIYSNNSGVAKRINSSKDELKTLGKVVINLQNSIPSNSILLLNVQQTGVYRSLYEIKTYEYMIDWLSNDLDLLPAVERAGKRS